jgi:hypothetical protein
MRRSFRCRAYTGGRIAAGLVLALTTLAACGQIGLGGATAEPPSGGYQEAGFITAIDAVSSTPLPTAPPPLPGDAAPGPTPEHCIMTLTPMLSYGAPEGRHNGSATVVTSPVPHSRNSSGLLCANITVGTAYLLFWGGVPQVIKVDHHLQRPGSGRTDLPPSTRTNAAYCKVGFFDAAGKEAVEGPFPQTFCDHFTVPAQAAPQSSPA